MKDENTFSKCYLFYSVHVREFDLQLLYLHNNYYKFKHIVSYLIILHTVTYGSFPFMFLNSHHI